MQKNIKIVNSPFNPPLGIVGDIVIQLHVPYSENDVTIIVNPNTMDYKENADRPGVKVRQVTLTTSTDETKQLQFDFKDRNAQNVNIAGKNYNIKLMNIGKENIQGQDFLFFEFFISGDD